jgi:hypothetical protein
MIEQGEPDPCPIRRVEGLNAEEPADIERVPDQVKRADMVGAGREWNVWQVGLPVPITDSIAANVLQAVGSAVHEPAVVASETTAIVSGQPVRPGSGNRQSVATVRRETITSVRSGAAGHRYATVGFSSGLTDRPRLA